MSKRYEVLLRREGGLNKTVIIDDCLSEREAKETAESMYGMEALRAIWKPDNSSNSSNNSSSGFSSGGSTDETSILGLIGVVCVGAALYIVYHLWPIFVGLGALYLIYKVFFDD